MSKNRSGHFQAFEFAQTLVGIVLKRVRHPAMKSYLICESNNRIAGTSQGSLRGVEGHRPGFGDDPAYNLPVYLRKARDRRLF